MKVTLACSCILLAAVSGCGRKVAPSLVEQERPASPSPTIYEPPGRSLPSAQQEQEEDVQVSTPSPRASVNQWRQLQRTMIQDFQSPAQLSPDINDPTANLQKMQEITRKLNQYQDQIKRTLPTPTPE